MRALDIFEGNAHDPESTALSHGRARTRIDCELERFRGLEKSWCLSGSPNSLFLCEVRNPEWEAERMRFEVFLSLLRMTEI